jgi:hypothetical protein
MSIIAELISVPWIICIAFLIAAQVRHSKLIALCGDIMLAVSFGATSAILIYAKSYWLGGAFAVPAIRQIYVLLAPRFRTP